MKKCRFCDSSAIVRLPYANLSLCGEHFKGYYIGRIRRVLDKHKIHGEVLVAISGGKDSMALLHALNEISKVDDRANFTAFHINLGIFDYSRKSEEIVREFSKKLGVVLIVYDLKKEIGYTIPELIRVSKRPPCAVCGIVKRWVLNKVAYECGFDYLATGHNIDDISTILLKALLSQDMYTILRMQSEFSPPRNDIKLVGKIRPQFYLSEMENRLYAELNKIPVIGEDCPLSKGATLHKYRSLWDHILKTNPVSQINFVRSILKLREQMAAFKQPTHLCKKCEFPTESETELCAFCRLIDSAGKRNTETLGLVS